MGVNLIERDEDKRPAIFKWMNINIKDLLKTLHYYIFKITRMCVENCLKSQCMWYFSERYEITIEAISIDDGSQVLYTSNQN